MSEENIFPLSLTNFEAALLADDRPAYPMTVIYRLRFTGFLELAAFQSALETVTRRHPLLRAVIGRNRLGQLVWKHHPNWQPKILRQARPTPSGFPHMTYLDPRQEAGIRWWVLERDNGHDVIVQGHHCNTDGVGINTVIEDLLISYANQCAQNSTTALRPLDAQRLLRRGVPKLFASKIFMVALKQIRGLVGIHEFLGRSPVPLMGKYSTTPLSTTTHDEFPAIISQGFDLSETKKIKTAAKSSKVTMNMLLLRDLFLAINVWRKKQGIAHNEDWLRIAIPINLRGAADATMPMANSVSMVFPDRQAVDLEDENRLLMSIHDQLALIKQLELEYTYILSLGMARLVPGQMSRISQADSCQSTTYLSNLGIVLGQVPLPRQEDGHLICGNVVLESVDLVSVLRPHTNAGFLIYNYAGQLHLTLQYDPWVMTAEQAKDLLDTYVRQIRGTLSGVGNA